MPPLPYLPTCPSSSHAPLPDSLLPRPSLPHPSFSSPRLPTFSPSPCLPWDRPRNLPVPGLDVVLFYLPTYSCIGPFTLPPFLCLPTPSLPPHPLPLHLFLPIYPLPHPCPPTLPACHASCLPSFPTIPYHFLPSHMPIQDLPTATTTCHHDTYPKPPLFLPLFCLYRIVTCSFLQNILLPALWDRTGTCFGQTLGLALLVSGLSPKPPPSLPSSTYLHTITLLDRLPTDTWSFTFIYLPAWYYLPSHLPHAPHTLPYTHAFLILLF